MATDENPVKDSVEKPVDDSNYFHKLSWGTLFNLMQGAMGERAKGNDRINSRPGKITDPNMVRSLIKVLAPEYSFNETSSFKSYVSCFRVSKKVVACNLPFDDMNFAAMTKKIVTSDPETYVAAAYSMQEYVREYLVYADNDIMDKLASRIVGIVEKDDTINWDGENGCVFYVDPKRPEGLTKRILVGEKHFSIPCLLLGMWEYVIRKQEGYTVGYETFDHWHKDAESNQTREIKDELDIDDKNNRGIHTDNKVPDITEINEALAESQKEEPAKISVADNGVIECVSEDSSNEIVNPDNGADKSSKDRVFHSLGGGRAIFTPEEIVSPAAEKEPATQDEPLEPVIPGVKLLFPQSWSQDEIDEFMAGVDYTAPDTDPVWPADIDPESYNLLMSHTIDFMSGSIELDKERCGNIQEYSDPELVAKYGSFTHDQMDEICHMPVLLMEENKPEVGSEPRIRKIAYVGICKNINRISIGYRFRWQMLFAFPQETIRPALDYLNIDSGCWPHGEMRRTHQAFKYSNLCEELREEAGIEIPVPVEHAKGSGNIYVKNGDYIHGNKIMGDNVQGNKYNGDYYAGPVTINKTEHVVTPASFKVAQDALNLNYSRPLIKSKEFFSIIVSDDFNPAKHVLTINKKMTLRPREYTEDDIFHKLCRLQSREMEEIRTYRTMFMKPVIKDGDDIAPNQNVYFGYVVTDVNEKTDVFEVTYICENSLPVKYIADFLGDIGVDGAPYHMELMDAHWAIKRGDLQEILARHGINID